MFHPNRSPGFRRHMTSHPEELRAFQAQRQTASYHEYFRREYARDPAGYFSELRKKLTMIAGDTKFALITDGKFDEFTAIQIRTAINADPARADEVLNHQLSLVQPAALDITPEKRAYFEAFKKALQPFAEEALREKIRKDTDKQAGSSGSR